MYLLLISTSQGESSNTKSDTLESLKRIFTNPIFYIVIGCFVLLILLIYFIRRFVKAKPNAATIIIRRGKIFRVLNKDNPNYFLVPFIDSVGAVISSEEKTFTSDKLFINNGPDSLYKINYMLKYKVVDPKGFYKFINNLQVLLPTKLNDELRAYADQGNALNIVKHYREKNNEIIDVINKAISDYFIEAIEFKINYIEPIGK